MTVGVPDEEEGAGLEDGGGDDCGKGAGDGKGEARPEDAVGLDPPKLVDREEVRGRFARLWAGRRSRGAVQTRATWP